MTDTKISDRQRMVGYASDLMRENPEILSPEIYDRAVADKVDDARSFEYWKDVVYEARRALGIRVRRQRKVAEWNDAWTRYGLKKGMDLGEQEKQVREYVSRRARAILREDERASSGDVMATLQAEGFPFDRSKAWWKRTVARARMDAGIAAPGKGGTTKATRSERHRFIAYARQRLAKDASLSSTQIAKMARADGMRLQRTKAWVIDCVSTARKQMGIQNGRAPAPKPPREKPDYSDIPDLDGPKRLASAVIALAVQDASASHLDNERKPLKARLAAAWLQSPECTAVWAGALGVDSDAIASRSKMMHGRPTFSAAEIEVLS